MTLEQRVLQCVRDAGGCAKHFQYQIFKQGKVVDGGQVSAALPRLKKKNLVKCQGTYWSAL